MAKKPEAAGSMSLAERMMNNSTSKLSARLDKSVLVNQRDIVTLPVIGMNLAFSGEVDGGFTSSITTWAGPSKHFKTLFALIQVKAYLDRYPDGVCLLYDSEFGSPLSYFTGLGIDPARVIHTPVLTLEELRHDIVVQLKGINRGDRVITMIDSVGNLASAKETEDAEKGGDKADMTRAKVAKSLFRIITPHYALKDIPLVVVNHTYQTIEMFSKTVVGGGTGSIYASDNIFILGRQQDRPQGSELLGYNFIINIEKSRYTKEKKKIPIYVSMEKGLDKYSGMADLAIEAGLFQQAAKGKYYKTNFETGEVDETKSYGVAALQSDRPYMKTLVESTQFKDYCRNEFKLSSGDLLSNEE
jgi:RecA/RadA recombinase